MIDFGVLSNGVEDRDADHEYPPVTYPTPETMPTVRDPFDAAPLLALFDRYHKQVNAMTKTAYTLVIADDKSAAQAAEYTTQAKKLAHILDKKRQEEKAPYLAITSVLDKTVKTMTDRLAGVQKTINAKLQPYYEMKERQRQEAQRRAEAEARALQAKLDAEEAVARKTSMENARLDALKNNASQEEAAAAARTAAAMVESAPVVVAQVVADETRQSTDAGTVALKKEWVAELIDIRLVPDECIEARKEEISKAVQPWGNAQVKAGIRNIPGWSVFEKTEIKTRVK